MYPHEIYRAIKWTGLHDALRELPGVEILPNGNAKQLGIDEKFVAASSNSLLLRLTSHAATYDTRTATWDSCDGEMLLVVDRSYHVSRLNLDPFDVQHLLSVPNDHGILEMVQTMLCPDVSGPRVRHQLRDLFTIHVRERESRESSPTWRQLGSYGSCNWQPASELQTNREHFLLSEYAASGRRHAPGHTVVELNPVVSGAFMKLLLRSSDGKRVQRSLQKCHEHMSTEPLNGVIELPCYEQQCRTWLELEFMLGELSGYGRELQKLDPQLPNTLTRDKGSLAPWAGLAQRDVGAGIEYLRDLRFGV